MANQDKVPVRLGRVPETLLWNLYHRAYEARQPRTVLHDPKAIELVDRLDFPFEETFGPPHPLLAQGQGLRVRSFDGAVRDFLAEHPTGTVVNLAEGLETQFWRVDNGRAHWLCVELPETAELRRSLLPDTERRRILARSVLDLSWRDEVDPGRGVLITAQGLLMYLRPGEVRELIAACAERFRGGSLVFDAVPRWLSAGTQRAETRPSRSYVMPAMPWGLNAGELQKVRTAHPAVVEVRELHLPRGRGPYFGALTPVLYRLPGVRNLRPTMTAIARFA
ncbi:MULTISPECIES: class I SAM-dependent methyltransferase [unclassified Streptomyces]|uniref:Class I SAM-dependent methyltransferase n=1 Tax=Streptomyces lonegramiae TaxID=3075524 RepID=A0ABU2XW49_9ACTN|nr:class I SAM-dependent methyltransferase [Streptomyces sp. DSM 41529]MDT0549689.1 class I SAM-dependent methyltransferase [Streptomyces sp. DSM 41529]